MTAQVETASDDPYAILTVKTRCGHLKLVGRQLLFRSFSGRADLRCNEAESMKLLFLAKRLIVTRRAPDSIKHNNIIISPRQREVCFNIPTSAYARAEYSLTINDLDSIILQVIARLDADEIPAKDFKQLLLAHPWLASKGEL